MSLGDPALATWAQVYSHLGDGQSLEFHALKGAIDVGINPFGLFMRGMLCHRKIANDDEKRMELLEEQTENVQIADLDDYEDESYVFDGDDEEEEENDEAETSRKTEVSPRHPNSSSNDAFVEVKTKVCRNLWALDLVAPGGSKVCSLRPSAQDQISVRLDEADKCLYYDCFEYVPDFVDWKSTLPTHRQLRTFDDTVNPEPKRQNPYYGDDVSDDESEDEDDASLDIPVTLREGASEETRKSIHLKAVMGAFLNSKVYRIKVPFEKITGMLLRVTQQADSPQDQTGVLILELESPVDDFCARCVASRYLKANEFHPRKDWTGEKVASAATRHYIYACSEELQSLAAHMCQLDPRLKQMMTPAVPNTSGNNNKKKSKKRKKNKGPVIGPSNALSGTNIDVFYGGTPMPVVHPNGKKKAGNSHTSKMTPEQVDQLLVIHGFHTDNRCLKAAILRGHVKLTPSTTLDTVLYTGPCHACGGRLQITWGEAMDQRDYAGLDYEEGGQNAPIQCHHEECGGNYITQLCDGKPSFDSGKSHNHCTQCPDFGICMGDYRQSHCGYCGLHFFEGLSGFRCNGCGGGKAGKIFESLTEESPDMSLWNGQGRGIERVMHVLHSQYYDLMMMTLLQAHLSPGDGSAPNMQNIMQILMSMGASSGDESDDD